MSKKLRFIIPPSKAYDKQYLAARFFQYLAEMNINIDDIPDKEFDTTARIIEDFVSSTKKETGCTISIRFEEIK